MAVLWGHSIILLIYTATHIVASIATIGLTVYVAQNYWGKPIGRMFTALVAATSIGIIGTVVRVFANSHDMFIAATVLKYVGIGTAPILFLFVALLYDGKNHWVTRRTVTTSLVLPVLTLFVIATIQSHELFYTRFSTASVGSLAAISVPGVGPWYWLFLVYDWGAIAIGTLILIFAAINQSAFYRYQLAFLLPAVSIAWAANIAYAVYSWPHPVLDPTAVGFAVADALLAFGIFTTKMIDITPTARSLVLDAIDDSVFVIDPNDRVIDINDAARSLIDSKVIFGKPISDVLPPEILQVDSAETTTIQLTLDSRRRFYRHRQLPIGPDGTHGTVIVLTEITSQKESQQQIEDAHEQLRQIIDLIPDPLFVKNIDDEVMLSNEANAELLGSTPEEVEGTPEPEAMPDVQNYEQYRQRDIEVIETRNSTVFEEKLTSADGEAHIFQTTRIPFETAGDDEDAVLGYARDVTDLKNYEQELEATKDRLEQTNEELETLNRILRHDIRNDTVVQSRLGGRLREHVDEDGEEYLEQLLARGEHIADITTGMRTLMQTMLEDQQDLSAIRLDTILEAEVKNVTAAYEDAKVRITGEIPQVTVQANQMLSSVFKNLLENAVQHNDAEMPAIAVSVAERDETVVVRIADNGPGIQADVADELFGQGEKGLDSKGTGIGLYLVTKLLDKYDGDIWVEDGTAQGGVRTDGDRGSQDIPDPDGEWNETVDGAVFAVELPKSN